MSRSRNELSDCLCLMDFSTVAETEIIHREANKIKKFHIYEFGLVIDAIAPIFLNLF